MRLEAIRLHPLKRHSPLRAGMSGLFLLLHTACFSIGGEAQSFRNIPQIKHVQVEGDGLSLQGSSLDRVQKVYLKGATQTYEYKIISQNPQSLVSQALGSFLVALDKTYDIILQSADAEVLNQVTVSLDGAVGGTLSSNLLIPSGRLVIGDNSSIPQASPSPQLHVVSSVGGSATGGISSEGLTVQSLLSTTGQSTYVSLFSGGNTNLQEAGFLYFGTSNPLITSSFYIGSGAVPKAFSVTSAGNVNMTGALGVTGAATLANTTVGGTLGVTGAATLANTTVGGTLGVTGATTLASTTVGGTLGVTGVATLASTTVGGTLEVTGATTLRSPLTLGTSPSTCTLSVSNGAVVTTCTSDQRLKKEIQPIRGALEKVLAIDGVSYRWKRDPQGAKQVGFIAQDLQKTVPELVVEDADQKYLQVAYAPYVAILNQAIKEFYQKVFSSEGELTRLQKRVAEQDSKILSLERKMDLLIQKLEHDAKNSR